MISKRKTFTYNEALEKAQRYCAFQERSYRQIRTKAFEWGLGSDEAEELIADLITSNFLNEQRFAEAFVRGKFNQKRWGRNKILSGLRREGVSEYSAELAIKEIDESEYLASIRTLAIRKSDDLKGCSEFELKGKVARYLIQKGYEQELIWETINRLYK